MPAKTTFLFLVLVCLLSACSASQPTQDPLTFPTMAITLAPTASASPTSGGEPRSQGYWLLWNTCAEGNQSETARKNGGRQAGWIILDDLLADPGILVGEISVESCPQSLDLLSSRDLQGVDQSSDPAYNLASQLFTAQLNLAAGSQYCPASDQAVQEAQLLLLALQFNGEGSYLGPPKAGELVESANQLVTQLASYNAGVLCR